MNVRYVPSSPVEPSSDIQIPFLKFYKTLKEQRLKALVMPDNMNIKSYSFYL